MRRRFFKIYQIFPLIGPQKGPAPLFEHIWIPFSRASFLPSLVEIGLVVLGRTDAAPYHKLSWPPARWANNQQAHLVSSQLVSSHICAHKSVFWNKTIRLEHIYIHNFFFNRTSIFKSFFLKKLYQLFKHIGQWIIFYTTHSP